jgi:hypothetical protein
VKRTFVAMLTPRKTSGTIPVFTAFFHRPTAPGAPPGTDLGTHERVDARHVPAHTSAAPLSALFSATITPRNGA